MNRLVSARKLYLAGVLLVAVAMGSALYLQYEIGLAPCPLCVIQRMGFIAAALFALVAALVGRRGLARPTLGTLAVVSALGGGGVAAWHAWLLAHPPETLGCGRPFEWFSDDFPLVTWLPKLFRGDGDCLAVDWKFLGLNIPHLSALTFLVLILLLSWATAIAMRERARR
jgi:protein dithiol:quinone oxidoreductase